MLISPDKFLRKAYLGAMGGISINKYADVVPADRKHPSYILLHSSSKQRTAVSKNGWEWNVQIVVDIVLKGSKGFSEGNVVEDIEAEIIDAIENGITVDNFNVKSTVLLNSQQLNLETPTESIQRRILTYEHWLCQV